MKRKGWIAISLVISLLLAGCAGRENEPAPSGGSVQSGVSTEGNCTERIRDILLEIRFGTDI